MKIAIVGAGLFGSAIGRLAQGAGHEVWWHDDLRDLSGSQPSAGLIKPSWLQGFGDAGKIGLKVIDNLVGLETMRFRFNGMAGIDVHHVHPQKLLVHGNDPFFIRCKVHEVGNGYLTYTEPSREFDPQALEYKQFDLVLVAAGIWTRDLLPAAVREKMPRIDALKGTAFYFRGQVPENTMTLWAPFKQLKVFNRDGEIWAGDSTGMSPKTYTELRKHRSYERCEDAVTKLLGSSPTLAREVSGLRPVVAGSRTGYFNQLAPKLYVSTGGGKMGTVLAGYHAHMFLEVIQRG